jgi:hypothetical protein
MSGPSLLDISFPPRAPAVTDEMWQHVANELDAISRPIPCNSGGNRVTPPTPAITGPSLKKSIFLMLDSDAGGDYAIECECNEDSSVSSVLEGAVLPHPVNFAAAEIAVHRPSEVVEDGVVKIENSILPVRWDQATGKPTKCTNHALQARDLVWVKLTASADTKSEAVAAAYSQGSCETRSNMGKYRLEQVTHAATQIQYNIQIIEDSRGCMTEYEPLRRGVPMMYAESKTLLPAMRMLQKHQLIRQLSSPQLICTAGQTAQVRIGGETSEDSDRWEGVRLEVASEKAENGLMVELAMHATQQKRDLAVRTALLVEPGQTIVLNANAIPAQEGESKQQDTPVYVVLTPEEVR